MKLNDEQLQQFEDDGFVIIPELFSAEEVAVLKGEIPGIFEQRRDENFREKDGDTVRTAFATHTYNDVYANFVRHPRILEPAEQLLDGQVYVHQFKLNAKAAFNGDVWQWHQDYGTWKRDDDMPESNAMNLAVYLDEVNEFNGPLYLIPKSHKRGVLEAGHDTSTTSYPLWTLDEGLIREMVDEGGIVAPKGPAGTGFFFHSCLVHASPPNISPWHRLIVYISYNNVENYIRQFKRSEWIAHRDFTPLEMEADDCLLNIAAAE
jgi:ectoine hydroxylase